MIELRIWRKDSGPDVRYGVSVFGLAKELEVLLDLLLHLLDLVHLFLGQSSVVQSLDHPCRLAHDTETSLTLSSSSKSLLLGLSSGRRMGRGRFR